jgi:general secretion pathway protein B
VSYILDALRKSDQMRRRGAAPTLLLGQAVAAAPKRPAPLAYGLLALVLLGTGMAIGWLHPWQSQSVAPVPLAGTATGISQSKAPAAQLTLAPKPQLQPQNPAAATPVIPAPTPAQVAVPVAAPVPPRATAVLESGRPSDGRQSAPPKAAAGVSTQAAAPRQHPAMGSNRRAAPAAPAASVITMAELPVAIQQDLPPMSVSVHAYSGKPAERLVDINGHLLHEGEDVAPGLRLEQITPEGMILSYKGYTFRRGVR